MSQWVTVIASFISTILFVIAFVSVYRLSVQMRTEYHAKTRRKVEAFWKSVENDYPGTLARLEQMNKDTHE